WKKPTPSASFARTPAKSAGFMASGAKAVTSSSDRLRLAAKNGQRPATAVEGRKVTLTRQRRLDAIEQAVLALERLVEEIVLQGEGRVGRLPSLASACGCRGRECGGVGELPRERRHSLLDGLGYADFEIEGPLVSRDEQAFQRAARLRRRTEEDSALM